MKIVTLTEFLKLPAYTVYQKYSPCIFEEIEIKVNDPDGVWEPSWLAKSIYGFAEGSTGSGDNFYIIDSGNDFKWDLESVGRDGMYDDKQLFAVWDKDDVKRLITQLSDCI